MFKAPNHIGSQYVSGAVLEWNKSIPVNITMTGGGSSFVHNDTAEIIWLLSSEAVVEVLHGGEVLKKSSTHNDHYGFLTSIQNMEDYIERYAKHYSIGCESTAEIRLSVNMCATPYMEKDADKVHNATASDEGGKLLLIYTHNLDLRTPVFQEDMSQMEFIPDERRIESMLLDTNYVYSSQHSDEKNKERLDQFRTLWRKDGSAASVHAKGVFNTTLDNFICAKEYLKKD
jgi:hypothetical protein